MSSDWGNLHMLRVFDHLKVPRDLAEPAATSTVSPERLAAKQEGTEAKLNIYMGLIALLLSAIIALLVYQIRETSDLKAEMMVIKSLEERR